MTTTMTTNPEPNQAAEAMHHSPQMQEKIYNSQSISGSQDTTSDELKAAVQAMHHSQQMQEKIYNS
jgi:hypothetical protein